MSARLRSVPVRSLTVNVSAPPTNVSSPAPPSIVTASSANAPWLWSTRMSFVAAPAQNVDRGERRAVEAEVWSAVLPHVDLEDVGCARREPVARPVPSDLEGPVLNMGGAG